MRGKHSFFDCSDGLLMPALDPDNTQRSWTWLVARGYFAKADEVLVWMSSKGTSGLRVGSRSVPREYKEYH